MRQARGAKGRRLGTITAGATILTLGLFSGLSATAGHIGTALGGSNFEIDADANFQQDHASPSIDWASPSLPQTRKEDSESGKNDESFGQGSKEDTAHPTVVSGSIPPNKSDLKWFGVHQEGTTSTGFLNLFWTRVQDPTGTTNMDFEFNANYCEPSDPTNTPCSNNGITPLRTPGDILITYDLAKGGTVPIISMREWQAGGSWGTPTLLSDTSDAAGSINTSPISSSETGTIGSLSTRTFGEAQIKLSSIFSPGTCRSIGSAYLKSRSSDSFTAALKDFVPPVQVDITNCITPSISTAQSWYPNDSATLSASGFGNLAGSVTFELYDNAACNDPDGPTGLLYTETKSVSGASPQTVSTNNGPSSATKFAATSSQTVYWKVSYTSTNPGHNDVTSPCGRERTALTINNNFSS